jgi:hypothetical protein
LGKVVKGTGDPVQDAIPFSKGKQKLFKGALGLKKPKVDTSAQDEALEQQRLQMARLDEEENRRRKRLFSAAQGVRAYRGSPLFRAAPGDTAGVGAAVARAVGAASARAGARRGSGGYAAQ